MAEIVQELTIEALPENVFEALTQPDGIATWWSNHVTAEQTVGSLYSIEETRAGWEYFLGSLKPSLETGKGVLRSF